jgi:hypothetical protein
VPWVLELRLRCCTVVPNRDDLSCASYAVVHVMDLLGPALLSGLFAGCVAIGVTTAIERFGGQVGGVLGSSPTTIIAACVGLSSRLSGDDLIASMFSVPPGMLVDAGFLLVWRLLPPRLPSLWSFKRKLATMVGCSLSVWVLGALVVVSLNVQGFTSLQQTIAFGCACTAILATVGIVTCFTPIEAPKGTNAVPLKALLLRGCVAFVAITVAVLISKLSDVAAGFASTFPAIFITSMVSLWVSQGNSVSSGAAGPMILGSTSVPAYAMIFCGFMGLGWNAFAAAAISWPLAVCVTSLPITFFLRWRRSVSIKAPAAVVDDQAQLSKSDALADDASRQETISIEEAQGETPDGGNTFSDLPLR